jgi:hypothetical protein
MYCKPIYYEFVVPMLYHKEKTAATYCLTAVYLIFCDSGGTRTHNQQNRNLPFYPLNYGASDAKLLLLMKSAIHPSIFIFHSTLFIYHFFTTVNAQ